MGTASFINHKFLFGPKDYEESNIVLKHFQIDAHGTQNLYYYDPLTVEGDKEMTEKNLATLTMSEYEKYSKMDRNRKFADEYFNFTRRAYMTMYPRDKPKHFMWPADHIGQVNNIVDMWNFQIPDPNLLTLSHILFIGFTIGALGHYQGDLFPIIAISW